MRNIGQAPCSNSIFSDGSKSARASMSSDLFTQEEIAMSLVRVAEITERFMGPED